MSVLVRCSLAARLRRAVPALELDDAEWHDWRTNRTGARMRKVPPLHTFPLLAVLNCAAPDIPRRLRGLFQKVTLGPAGPDLVRTVAAALNALHETPTLAHHSGDGAPTRHQRAPLRRQSATPPRFRRVSKCTPFTGIAVK